MDKKKIQKFIDELQKMASEINDETPKEQTPDVEEGMNEAKQGIAVSENMCSGCEDEMAGAANTLATSSNSSDLIFDIYNSGAKGENLIGLETGKPVYGDVDYLGLLNSKGLNTEDVNSCILYLMGRAISHHYDFKIYSLTTGKFIYTGYSVEIGSITYYPIDLKRIYDETGTANFKIVVDDSFGAESIVVNKSKVTINDSVIIEFGQGDFESIKVKKFPDSKLCIADYAFDTSGMEVVGVNNDGSENPITWYQYSPMRKLTVDDRYITITYNNFETKLPIRVAQKMTDKYMQLEHRVYSNGAWSAWEFYDTINAKVAGSASEQIRFTFSIDKQQVNLGKSKSAGIELWLKTSQNNYSTQGHVRINNATVPLSQGYAHAYVGKIKSSDTKKIEIAVEYVDADIEFDNFYVVLCRDNDPATFNANKQISLTNAIAQMDLLMGKADTVFTDFAADSTLLGLDIQHIYGQNDEDFGCGNHFRLNLYERLDTDAFTTNDFVKSHCYTDAYGNKHGFNVMFYIECIDYDNLGVEDDIRNHIIKKYIPYSELSNVTYDKYSGKLLLNEWYLEYEQVTVDNQIYLEEPTETVVKIQSSLSFNETTKPVKWLRNENITKGFNKSGNLVMLNDDFGNYIQIFYNNNGLISSIKDKSGNTIELNYSSGKLSYILDNASKKKVKYVYTSNKLTSINYCTVGSSGADSVYKTLNIDYTRIYKDYELTDAILQVESSDHILSLIEYEDGASYDTRIKGVKTYSTISEIPNGTAENTQYDSLTMNYDDENRIVSVTDEYDNKEIYKFSDEGNLIEYYEVTNGLVSKAEKNEYNPYGSSITISASQDSLCKSSYESYNFVDGTKTESTLNLFNKPSSEKIGNIPTGDGTYKTQEKNYEYDELNRCIREICTEKFFNSDDNCVSTNYYIADLFYDNSTEVLLKKVIHVAHDEGGTRVEEFADAEEYTYDEKGNVTTVKKYRIDAAGHATGEDCICSSSATTDIFYTEQSYDSSQRAIGEKDERGLYTTQYGYVSGTNLVNKITYPDGGVKNFAYDSENRVTQLSGTADGVENKNTTNYTSGEVTKYSNSGNNALEYVYDSKRRIKQINLNNVLYEKYEYSDNLSVNGIKTDKVTLANANNEKFAVEAAKDGSYIKQYYNDSLILQNTYDAKGQLTNMSDSLSGASITYTYNSVGALLTYSSVKGGGSYNENINYDVKGRITNITYTGLVSRTDRFTYALSAKDKVQQITTGTYTVNLNQDLYERYTGKTVKVGTTTVDSEVVTYVKQGDHATGMPNQITYPDSNISYTYDGNGNITKIMQGGVLQAQYSYDTLGRLIREDNNPLGKSYFYTYDNNGNITAKEYCAFTTGSHTLGTGTVTTYTYDKDKMIKFGIESCVYDKIGNPRTYRGNTLRWTRGRKLISYNGNTFSYDAQGRRISKNSIKYIYDSNGRLLKQSNGLEFFYDTTGLAGLTYNGTAYVYRKDVQGNIIAILDNNGRVMVQYYYDAWGNHTIYGRMASTIGNLNPFRYRSYYFDTETKLYFLQSRYYDPETGRFLNMDSIDYADPETINGLNLFAYCNNNPVMNVDPDGTWSWKSILKTVCAVAIVIAASAVAIATAGTAVGLIAAGAAIGGAVGGTIGGLTNAYVASKNGEDVFEAFADGLFSGTVTGSISGAVAASPIGLGGQILINTALSTGQYCVETLISGDEFSYLELAISLFSGVVSGYLGGSGAMSVGNELGASFALNRVVKAGVSNFNTLLKPILKSSIGTILGNLIHSLF
ncbi:MAG: RHS repeat-associated core domain-containing protein [Clostridia bacterium]|nr:RHS repeat-associated core domain-containing protein [Clostridia bacterium]